LRNFILNATFFKMSQELTLTLGPRNQSILCDGICD